MAPSNICWRRFNTSQMHRIRVIHRNLRRTCSSFKRSHGSNKTQDDLGTTQLKLHNKIFNYLPTIKWIKGGNSSEQRVLITSPHQNMSSSSSMDNQEPKESSVVPSDVSLSTSQSFVSLWRKRVSNQLTSITLRIVSHWSTNYKQPINNSNHNSTSASITVKSSTTLVNNNNISRAALESRAQYLLRSMAVAESSNMSRHIQIQELCKFLKLYPQAQGFIAKAGVRQLQLVKRLIRDPLVLEDIEEGLALLGHHCPPSGWGIRILSIDGGGLRGMMALEILRQLEERTGRPIHQLFDYICGVSTGSVLAILLGSLKCSVAKCEQLYKQIGTEIFQQNTIWGTGKLVLSHAFYDTALWTDMLRRHMGPVKLIDTARDPTCPKIVAVSAVVSGPRLEPFLFRNYEYPPRVMSRYRGSHQAELWEAARASAAAPGYFEEFKYGKDIHQDGGILVNNPTALAIHECKLLWPREALQCVISLGNGRYEPQPSTAPVEPTYTGLKNKLMKIIDSATDTEGVHTILHDLLDPTVYFRFNPYLSENITLDETRPEKIVQLQKDAIMYSRRNENKLHLAASTLTQSRSTTQHIKDFVSLKKLTYLGM